MEFKKLDDLLNKYFEGQSTREEEASLKAFFAGQEDLPEKYAKWKHLFTFYEWNRNETSSLRLDQIVGPVKRKKGMVRLFYYAAAACIIMLLGILFLQNKPEDKHVYAYINGKAVYDKEIAYQEAQKALRLLSANLNEGTKSLSHLSEFNKAKEIISIN